MSENTIIPALQHLLNMELPAYTREEQVKAFLQEKINDWLQHNFQALISLLYRVDISEEKLKYQLQQQPGEDAALIITNLILQRLHEKAVSKKQFRHNTDIPEEDKW